ncbi:MAG: glycine betaine ABC transporter substrate-binding protein [Spirochaetia bacterium]|jgi:osmoprotectant transport system substrate-binding protein/osmoprotectant transport system permease protein|nr:glycine betaine ABC transporter substrate-binding protein [Spirochaetales bacterium]MDX9784560.1 glycine betaine ABC transporter substrate-binding protein [Spirochaetia bacterium]
MVKKFFIIALSVLFAFGMLMGCSKKEELKPLVIYDGQFSEMKIIHQMAKLLVETHTDLKVEIRDEMAPVNNYRDLVSGGGSDLMNSYDGTLLTTYLKLDVSDVPEGETLYDFANRTAKEKDKVELLDKIGSENTYAIGVTQTLADKYGLDTISDLVAVAPELVFGAEHEFFSEEGSMKFGPFSKFYGLEFKEAKAIDLALKYSAIDSGNIDVTIVYSTDGMNKKVGLKVLDDDRSYFPEYNDALLVRSDLFERYEKAAPNLKEVLNKLGGQFTNEIMTDLTYEVDVNGKSPEEVARSFLAGRGLLNK